MRAMYCPTCEPKRLVMGLQSETYGNGNLSQVWECYFCGTTATTCVPCTVTAPNCETVSAGVDSAPQ